MVVELLEGCCASAFLAFGSWNDFAKIFAKVVDVVDNPHEKVSQVSSALM